MADMSTIKLSTRDVMGNMTIKLTVSRMLGIRLKLGLAIMSLGAQIVGTPVEVEMRGADE